MCSSCVMHAGDTPWFIEALEGNLMISQGFLLESAQYSVQIEKIWRENYTESHDRDGSLVEPELGTETN